jgi:hypothetical protein
MGMAQEVDHCLASMRAGVQFPNTTKTNKQLKENYSNHINRIYNL